MMVFPACAGMFRTRSKICVWLCGFPRVRGDVPRGTPLWGWRCRFSPRARGCSHTPASDQHTDSVFPACAGMFPSPHCVWVKTYCFPRVRGDVPAAGGLGGIGGGFSPRARGCSSESVPPSAPVSVFPACAGMFPHQAKIGGRRSGFPRVRGDVPGQNPMQQKPRLFSPRARGCSQGRKIMQLTCYVFPACAGMFPYPPILLSGVVSFPRVRGDVPCWSLGLELIG